MGGQRPKRMPASSEPTASEARNSPNAGACNERANWSCAPLRAEALGCGLVRKRGARVLEKARLPALKLRCGAEDAQ
jgi:hypothetical protein